MRDATRWLSAVIGLRLLFVWHLRQCRRDAAGLAVTNEVEFDRSIRRHHPDGARELAGILHLRAIDGGDDVAGFDSGLRRGAPALRLVNNRSCGRLQAEATGDIGSDWLDLHAKPAARDMPFLLELRDDHLGGIGRNIEPDADRAAGRRESQC